MSPVSVIARNTYRESIRSKVLYTVVCFAVLLVLVSTFFGAVSIGDQVLVIKDFGLFSISLFSVIYVVISGTSLLSKELARKTIYNILGKPVSRWEFLVGKYLGMLATVSVLVLLMGAGLMGFASLFEGHVDLLILLGCLYIIFELVIICAAAIFFSTFAATPVLSGMFTFGVFLAGRSVEYATFFLGGEGLAPMIAYLLKVLYWVLPHLDKLHVGNDVVYGIAGSLSDTATSFGYSVCYATILLLVGNIIFSRRHFQ